MKDKYNLTLEENVFIAKKNLVENIYNEAKLEGINVTFPQTYTILESGKSVAGLDITDLEKILNLRNAWRYAIDTIKEPISFENLLKINENVAKNEALFWGVLRTGNVGISGTDYMPEIPTEEQTKCNINYILSKSISDTEKGIELFLSGCRSQYFWDGNKRTSAIFANKFLIQNGRGTMSVPDKLVEEFNVLLTDYYNTNSMNKVKKFLYDTSLKGIDYPNGK